VVILVVISACYRYERSDKKPCGANAARRNELAATLRCGLRTVIWG